MTFAPDEFYCQGCGSWKKCSLEATERVTVFGRKQLHEIWKCPDGHGIEVLS